MDKWRQSKTAVFAAMLIVLILAGGLRWFRFDSFPPGLWYDEAYHLTTSQRITLGVDAPQLYYPDKTGEPAFFWLTAAALSLGAGHLAPRWIAALAGWLSVVLLFGAVRDILQPRLGRDAAWVAVASAAILGSNYAFLFNSRMGWEPTLATAVIIAAVWLFWRALRDGHRRDFFLAGILIGITPYTSVIARALPLLLLLIALLWLPKMRKNWSRFLSGGLLLSGTAVLIVSPLLWLFISQPGLFNRRLAAAAATDSLWRNLGLTLAGFLWRSEKALHRLPNRPIFDPVLAVLLVIGVGVVIWFWKRPSHLVWLLWLFTFLPAGMFSSPAPVFYRILPAIPAAAVLVAMGGYWCIQQAGRLTRLAQPVLLAAAIGLLMLSSWTTAYDYFVRWAATPNLSGIMDGGKWEAAETILAAEAETAVFVSIPEWQEPTVQYAIQSRTPKPRTFDGRHCLVVPAKNEQPLHFLSINGHEHRSLPLLASLYETEQVTTNPFFINQEPYFFNVHVPPGADVAIAGELYEPIQFGDILLRGVDVGETAVIGQPLPVTLIWQSTAPVSQSLTAFVHLLEPDDAASPLVAQHDGVPCNGTEPVFQWRPGELVFDEHVLFLGEGVENGRYLIGVGFYQSETFERLPATGNNVNVQFGEAIVKTINVQP